MLIPLPILVIFVVLYNSPREGFEDGLSTTVMLVAAGVAVIGGLGFVYYMGQHYPKLAQLEGINTPRKIYKSNFFKATRCLSLRCGLHHFLEELL